MVLHEQKLSASMKSSVEQVTLIFKVSSTLKGSFFKQIKFFFFSIFPLSPAKSAIWNLQANSLFALLGLVSAAVWRYLGVSMLSA